MLLETFALVQIYKKEEKEEEKKKLKLLSLNQSSN